MATSSGWGIAHGGAAPGFGSYFIALPEMGITVVGVANRRYAPVFEPCLEVAAILAANIAESSKSLSDSPSSSIDSKEAAHCASSIGALLSALAQLWDDSVAESLFHPAIWADISRLELTEKLTHFFRQPSSLSASCDASIHASFIAIDIDATCGELATQGGKKFRYFLNPFLPAQIQSLEFINSSE